MLPLEKEGTVGVDESPASFLLNLNGAISVGGDGVLLRIEILSAVPSCLTSLAFPASKGKKEGDGPAAMSRPAVCNLSFKGNHLLMVEALKEGDGPEVGRASLWKSFPSMEPSFGASLVLTSMETPRGTRPSFGPPQESTRP